MSQSLSRPQAALPLEVWLALALTVLVVFLAPLTHDAAWYLVATRRYLDGARLYVDLIEVNPPLMFWLMTPPTWLGRALGLSDPVTGNLLPALALVASTFLAARVLVL